MKGYFSEETLRQFAALAEETFGINFSEGGTYDFTRCVRPDGSAYGTNGKCRKGTEGESKEKKKRESEKREPMFSPLRGKNVSTSALDIVADNWRKYSGLELPSEDPGGNINKHDRVHVLFHEFLGGVPSGRTAIGKWLGTNKTGPSVAEEIFVSRLHEAAQAKGEGKKHKLSDEELGKKIAADLKGLNELGMIDRSELALYYNGNQPDFDKFVKKYREFENSPNYETLLDAANVAFPNYPKGA